MSQGRGGPLTMRCGKCRRQDGQYGRYFAATGRAREQKTAFGRATAYEYECPSCKNVGWTIHPSIEARAKALDVTAPEPA